LARGVYGRIPDVPGEDQWARRRQEFFTHVRAVIAAYAGRPVWLYGPTALQVLDVALPKALEDWTNCHILVPSAGARPVRQHVVAHCVSTEVRTWRRVGGLPVLHPVDHWLQLRGATDDELIEVGDGFMRRQDPLLTIEELRHRLGELAGTPGVKRARRLVGWLRPGTDSITETTTRLVLVHGGLPCPAVNAEVWCRATGWLNNVDMGYEAEKVAVEYDGAVHVANRRQMQTDAVRRRDLQDEGWLIITVTADQLHAPAHLVRVVESALIVRRAGAQR